MVADCIDHGREAVRGYITKGLNNPHGGAICTDANTLNGYKAFYRGKETEL